MGSRQSQPSSETSCLCNSGCLENGDGTEIYDKVEIFSDLSEALPWSEKAASIITVGDVKDRSTAKSKKKATPGNKCHRKTPMQKTPTKGSKDTPQKSREQRYRMASAERTAVEKISILQGCSATVHPVIEDPQLPDLGWPQQRNVLKSGEVLRGWLLKRKMRSAFHPQTALGSVISALIWVRRFFELRTHELVYWHVGDDQIDAGESPRGVFSLSEIDGVSVRGSHVTLRFNTELRTGLCSRPRTLLRLRCNSVAHAEQWSAALRAAAAERLRTLLPAEWDVAAMLAENTPAVRLVAEVSLPKGWNTAMQRLLDHSYLFKRTKDRHNRQLPVRLAVEDVIGVQNFTAWIKYTKARDNLSYKLESTRVVNIGAKIEPPALTSSHEDPIIKAALGELSLPANEQWLFHGTSSAGVQGIATKDFTLDLAGSHRGTLYGKGLYLAESSTKADEYAEEDENGICRMLVCRVALGRVLVDDSVKPNVDELIPKVRAGYDSLCGDRWTAVGTYREFVLFNQELVYPAYIISYKRVTQVELLSAFGAAANRGETEEAAKHVQQAARLAQMHLDPVVRYRVSMLLGAQAQLVAPVLVAALRDARPQVRQTAAFMLGQLGCHTTSATYVMPNKPEDPVRRAVVTSGVPALCGVLRDSHAEVRRAAAIGLPLFGADAASAVPGLVQRLQDDEHVQVREAAAQALGQLGSSLKHVASDLAMLAEIVARSLTDSKREVRKAVALALGQLGSHAACAVPPLIGCLSDDDETVRAASASALCHLPVASLSVAVVSLISCLEDSSSDTRAAAAAALGHIGCEASSALEGLMVCLHDSSPAVVSAAIHAVGQVGTPAAPTDKAARALAKFGKDTSMDTATRIAATTALGKLGPVASAGVPVLRTILKDTNDGLRKAAVAALGRMGPAAVPALGGITERIRDTCADVRRAASDALAALGANAQSQIPALEILSEDPLPEIREAADSARRQIIYQLSLAAVGDDSEASSGSEEFDEPIERGRSGSGSSDGWRRTSIRGRYDVGDKLELQDECVAYLYETGQRKAPIGRFPRTVMGVTTLLNVMDVGEARLKVQGTATLKCYQGWISLEDSEAHTLIKRQV